MLLSSIYSTSESRSKFISVLVISIFLSAPIKCKIVRSLFLIFKYPLTDVIEPEANLEPLKFPSKTIKLGLSETLSSSREPEPIIAASPVTVTLVNLDTIFS